MKKCLPHTWQCRKCRRFFKKKVGGLKKKWYDNTDKFFFDRQRKTKINLLTEAQIRFFPQIYLYYKITRIELTKKSCYLKNRNSFADLKHTIKFQKDNINVIFFYKIYLLNKRLTVSKEYLLYYDVLTHIFLLNIPLKFTE